MKLQCLHSDIISSLPQLITERILSFLPIRDAVRTSILSKNWRYSWAGIPELVCDDEMLAGSSYNKQNMKNKLADAIFKVLFLHRGPLVEFTLSVDLEMVEIDQIILYLSRSNTLKNFILENRSKNHYKLPSSFFSLQGPKYINLKYCYIEPPLTFNGFSTLTCLCLNNVEITPNSLKHFLTNCLQLQHFYLKGRPQKEFDRGNKFTLVELTKCVPSIQQLVISSNCMKYFASGVPYKLPTPFTHLKRLFLGVCLMRQDELSAILCLIKSSLNLEKIYLQLVPRTWMSIPAIQDYTDFKLDHLEELEMACFSNLTPEIEFFKRVLVNSPILKNVRIELNPDISVNEEVRILRDFIQVPFPRASPSTAFKIERPTGTSLIRLPFCCERDPVVKPVEPVTR